jgi:hypothetical protein
VNLNEDEDEDEDDGDEYSNHYEYEFYIDKKLFIINKNLLQQSIGFIKEVLGNDPMFYYNSKNPIEKIFYTIIPNCNIIIETNNIEPILDDGSIYMRSLIININC